MEGVRGSAVVPGVRIEVAADGRITALELTDPALAEAISSAHARALRQTRERVADLRRELTDDPVVSSALRIFIEADVAEPKSAQPAPRREPERAETSGEDENPHALPPEVRRRYGF